MTSTKRQDPRVASKAVPFKPLYGEESTGNEWFQLLSLAAGMAGLMMRSKVASWVALVSVMCHLSLSRLSELDWKNVLASMMFSVTGLVINYFGPVAPWQVKGQLLP